MTGLYNIYRFFKNISLSLSLTLTLTLTHSHSHSHSLPRTREADAGILFHMASQNYIEYLTLEILQSTLVFTFNLGGEEEVGINRVLIVWGLVVVVIVV